MLLQYLQIPFTYERLRRRLGTTEGGAAFEHLLQLQALGLTVYIRRNDDLRVLLAHLETWLPIIVAVETWPLPYWQSRTDLTDAEKETNHAVVVVGVIDDTVYLNDPSFAEAPQTVPVEAFLTAWSGFAYLYALIGLTEVE
jgi:ABC-type bacteriocin/lantibiotic exporter with double-glycine peptidase domain